MIQLNPFLIFKNTKLIKYLLIGFIFTISSPLIFIFLSTYFSRVLSIIILIPIACSIKFLVYKYWVFRKDIVDIRKFIIHIIPQYLVSILIAKLTEGISTIEYVAIIILIANGFLGYFWGNFLYSDKK